jgi:parallel beta-helix repeat protein
LSTAAQPLLTIQGYAVDGQANGRPGPGSTVDLAVSLGNLWGPASNVQANLTSSSPYVTINTGTAVYGSVATYATAASATPFRFTVSGAAPYGHDLAFNVQVTAAGGYTANLPLTVTTVPAVVYPPATINTQTWTNDRIYVINKETGIPVGQTLTIEPGTVVRFEGRYSLYVGGTLIADGSADQPIHFTSNKPNPAPSDWVSILFSDTSTSASFDEGGNYVAGSILRHTIVEYGQGINLARAAPFIANNKIHYVSHAGVWGTGTDGLRIIDNEIVVGQPELGTELGIGPLNVDGTFTIAGNTVSAIHQGISIGGSGPGTIANNTVRNSYLGIGASGPLTVTANRVVNAGEGLIISGGYVSHNLLASNERGIRIVGGSPTVISNTLAFNNEVGIYIENSGPTLHNNNFIISGGAYAVHNATTNNIDATANWWGTTNVSEIETAIYDGADQFGLGIVDYSNYLTEPEPSAPAYLRSLTISPDTTLGIQTGTFHLTFSRPMDQSVDPQMHFYMADPWLNFTTANSELPHDAVITIGIDKNGDKWVGTTHGGAARYSNGAWTTYNYSNSGLPGQAGTAISSIAIDNEGMKWFATFGTPGFGIASFDNNTWTVYNTSNSGLPDTTYNNIYTIVVDSDNSKWIGTLGGLVHFDGQNWTLYNTANSGLPNDEVETLVIDHDGNKWVSAFNSGLSHFDGNTWTVYNAVNSGLSSNLVKAIAIDTDGSKWIGTADKGLFHFDGITWTVYNSANSPLGSNSVPAIVIDKYGRKWIADGATLHRFDGSTWATYFISSGISHNITTLAIEADNTIWMGTNNGVVVFYGEEGQHIIDNAQWLNERQWRATFDITSLIQRGEQRIEVSGARDSSGVEIASDKRHTFTVDYAGEITDQTPPLPPWVWAWGVENEPTTVQAMWSATDPESAIIRYRYAIGATAGGTDIINWTTTTGASVTRTGLGLVEGQQYWFSVQAQNSGGLWSSSGQSSFIAGQPINQVYLPLIQR